MLAAGVRFHYVVFRNTADLLRQDRQNNFRTWRGLLAYLYGKPGLMRLLLRDLFTYFRPNFHPWQHDDRALAARALATLSPPLVAPMRSEEHTSELQSLMRISYAVFCLKKKKTDHNLCNTT